MLDPGGAGITSVANANTPAVTYGGGEFLVAFSSGTTSANITGARVTPGLAVQDPAGFTISNATNAQQHPALAFDGTNFLAVWDDARAAVSSGNVYDIYAARLSQAGAVLDANGIAVRAATGDQTFPAVTFDGSSYVVVWQDNSPGPSRLYGATLTTGGAVFASNFLVQGGAVPVTHPALASAGAGSSMVVYSRFDPGASYAANRARARLITQPGLGAPCTQNTDCVSGFCADGVCCNTACNAGACDACSVAAGAPTDGTCALLTGTPCNDGNACTQSDTCQAGTCVGGSPVVCTAQDACHDAGTCNPMTGMCSNPAKADGSACDDGNACTQTDTCKAGTCTGTNPVTCPMADQCHDVAACDPTTGMCAVTPKPDGMPCNDGDACTQTDTCQAGVCTGSNTVVCPAPDQCHDAGTCNPMTGTCSNPAKPDGTACDDGSACTQTDTCKAGVCTGGNPVVCAAQDQCHAAGTCDSTTGQCSNPAKPDGASCSDGDACTPGDVCKGGVCISGDPIDCPAKDKCHDVGTCNPTSGTCSSPKKPDGTPCAGGTCQNGTCSSNTGTGGAGGGSTSSSSSGGATSSSSNGGMGTGGAGGGEPGTGGAASSSSGGTPDGKSGCGCRTAGGDESAGGLPLAAMAVAVLARRRRVRKAA